MVYPYAQIPLVAEPIHIGRNDRECHRATFATQKQESPDAKVSCPPAVVESSRLIDAVNPYNSATFVENRLLQTVPKRKDSMNTLMSGMGVPCTGTLRASVLSDS